MLFELDISEKIVSLLLEMEVTQNKNINDQFGKNLRNLNKPLVVL